MVKLCLMFLVKKVLTSLLVVIRTLHYTCCYSVKDCPGLRQLPGRKSEMLGENLVEISRSMTSQTKRLVSLLEHQT